MSCSHTFGGVKHIIILKHNFSKYHTTTFSQISNKTYHFIIDPSNLYFCQYCQYWVVCFCNRILTNCKQIVPGQVFSGADRQAYAFASLCEVGLLWFFRNTFISLKHTLDKWISQWRWNKINNKAWYMQIYCVKSFNSIYTYLLFRNTKILS